MLAFSPYGMKEKGCRISISPESCYPEQGLIKYKYPWDYYFYLWGIIMYADVIV